MQMRLAPLVIFGPWIILRCLSLIFLCAIIICSCTFHVCLQKSITYVCSLNFLGIRWIVLDIYKNYADFSKLSCFFRALHFGDRFLKVDLFFCLPLLISFSIRGGRFISIRGGFISIRGGSEPIIIGSGVFYINHSFESIY